MAEYEPRGTNAPPCQTSTAGYTGAGNGIKKEVVHLKKRIITAVVLWLVLTALALPLCYNLDHLLSRQTKTLDFDIYTMCVEVGRNAQLLRMWLLVSGLCALGVIWALVGSAWIRYNNKLYTVVPGVKIPVPSGRGEHGTAWWMQRKDMGSNWTEATVQAATLQELLDAGAADIEEITQLRNAGLLDADKMLTGRKGSDE